MNSHPTLYMSLPLLIWIEVCCPLGQTKHTRLQVPGTNRPHATKVFEEKDTKLIISLTRGIIRQWPSSFHSFAKLSWISWISIGLSPLDYITRSWRLFLQHSNPLWYASSEILMEIEYPFTHGREVDLKGYRTNCLRPARRSYAAKDDSMKRKEERYVRETSTSK